ncbi:MULTISPECIES: transposase [Streptomyces]|uniref:Transposase n=1 Tax=Streptomyces evansiae TaxID=3075535 RepID=A0ABU2QVV0_9ACTN|nr:MULTISPECIES: transposase [unclassified Streptomyces]MDT0408579.1 transposase [Streptomyces sp. DSM 41979]
MVFDRYSAHRSKTVRAWLAEHEEKIELRFLPSYSPELTLDELVNTDVKRSLPHTHRARSRPNSPPRSGVSSTADNASLTPLPSPRPRTSATYSMSERDGFLTDSALCLP